MSGMASMNSISLICPTVCVAAMLGTRAAPRKSCVKL
jgi:hypothetical protein